MDFLSLNTENIVYYIFAAAVVLIAFLLIKKSGQLPHQRRHLGGHRGHPRFRLFQLPHRRGCG